MTFNIFCNKFECACFNFIEDYSPGFCTTGLSLDLNNDVEVKVLAKISTIEFGLKVYSTRYTSEYTTKINIEDRH